MTKLQRLMAVVVLFQCVYGIVKPAESIPLCVSCALQSGNGAKISRLFSPRYLEEEIGGVIASTPYFEARQDCFYPVPGIVVIASKRHIQSMDEFTAEERHDFMAFICKIRGAMRKALNISTVYVVQEEDSDHFHIWLFPRFEWMGKFGKKVSSIKPIMEWSLQNLNTEENYAVIREMVSRLRKALGSEDLKGKTMKQVASINRFKVNKLIRDKIPEHLEAKGILLKESAVSAEKYIDLLKAKLVEETREVLKAENPQDITEECADVLEVIEALCAALDVPYEKVREAQQKKRQEKGGFEKRVFGEYIEISSDNTKALAYYQARSEDYPLIDT